MKRIFNVLLAIMLCIMMIGCSSKTKSVNTEKVEDNLKETETIEETPETQEENTPEQVEEDTSKVKSSNDKISDDLYSFQVELNGDLYQFPMTYDDIIALGWQFKGDDTQTLDPNQYTIEQFTDGNGLLFSADIINLGMNVESFNKCLVGGFSMDENLIGDKEISLILPGGIQYGVSNMQDVISAYGDPTRTYEGSSFTTLTYEYASYQEVELNIDATSKVISSIEIRNFAVSEENNSQSTEVSSEVPSVVSDYKAPSALGDDLTEFIVEYDGTLYQIPAPVSEFEKNGWKVKSEESDPVVKAKDFGWVTLIKNNQSLRVIANNYADAATGINNCFVTSVKGDDNSTDIPITIQKGITRGLTKIKLEKALKGVKYDTEDSTSLYYYTIKGKDSSLDRVEIIVSKDTNLVQSIEVSNSPRR